GVVNCLGFPSALLTQTPAVGPHGPRGGPSRLAKETSNATQRPSDDHSATLTKFLQRSRSGQSTIPSVSTILRTSPVSGSWAPRSHPLPVARGSNTRTSPSRRSSGLGVESSAGTGGVDRIAF